MFDIFNEIFDVNNDGDMDLGEKTMECMIIDELLEEVNSHMIQRMVKIKYVKQE